MTTPIIATVWFPAVDVELGEDVEFARSMFDADPVDMPNSVRPR